MQLHPPYSTRIIMKKNLTTDYDDRQYMISEDFELYYYRDTGPVKRTGLHSHPYYEFYFFLEGNVELSISRNNYRLSYGDIFFVPPNTAHGVFVKDFDVPYRRFDLWLSVPFFNHMIEVSPDLNYFPELIKKESCYLIHTERTAFSLILNRLYSIIEEQKGNRFGKDTRILILISDLGLTVNRLAYEQFNKPIPERQDSLYKNICTYIDNNIDEELTLDRIANHFFLSKYYLSHVFKDNIGISIHRYITKRRLTMCHDAIIAGIPASQVCQLHGFDDYSSFYRAFKKEYGLSPKALSKQARLDIAGISNDINIQE